MGDNQINVVGVVFIVIGITILVGVGAYLLYHFVFSRNGYKRQIKELERKYTYLDALLIGQDSQYIHRLEIISRTNLLYVEKYNDFSHRFKEIYDGDDKFTESRIKQVKALIANNQYKNIKVVIAEARRAVEVFEDKVNQLDQALYNVIKPEEESRQQILKLKESFRRVKQIFYANSNDLELVQNSFTKIFDKLDQSFAEFEAHIEGAEYEDANVLIPTITKVVNSLDRILSILPNLCILSTKIIPDKINSLSAEYAEVEKKGIPLFNLSFRHKVEVWNITLATIRKKLVNLETSGVMDTLDALQNEIEDLRKQLQTELVDKDEFTKDCDALYIDVIDLEKAFLKICSVLPQIRSFYLLSDEQEKKIEDLKDSMNKLGGSRRSLDNYIHSATKQPYSVLKKKLDDLHADYESAKVGVDNFKSYLDSLKTNSEEAYSMVFVYYYRCKQIESLLRDMDIANLEEQYRPMIENCYGLLNDIDITLEVRPINVASVNELVEQLKASANALFDDVENKYREEQLAESAIVYANRDRNHQSDVHQQLSVLEKSFFTGDFVNVYHEANNIYKRTHVEDSINGK